MINVICIFISRKKLGGKYGFILMKAMFKSKELKNKELLLLFL